MITDLIRYFARFVTADAIKKLDPNRRHDSLTRDLMPLALGTIPAYIIGEELESVKRAVSAAAGRFLFLDFGEIQCTIDDRNRLVEEARTAVTVAERLASFNADMLTHTVTMDSCLASLVAVRCQMLSDKAAMPWLDRFGEDHTLVPFVSAELGSVGYTLLFTRRGYDTFGARDAMRKSRG